MTCAGRYRHFYTMAATFTRLGKVPTLRAIGKRAEVTDHVERLDRESQRRQSEADQDTGYVVAVVCRDRADREQLLQQFRVHGVKSLLPHRSHSKRRLACNHSQAYQPTRGAKIAGKCAKTKGSSAPHQEKGQRPSYPSAKRHHQPRCYAPRLHHCRPPRHRCGKSAGHPRTCPVPSSNHGVRCAKHRGKPRALNAACHARWNHRPSASAKSYRKRRQ